MTTRVNSANLHPASKINHYRIRPCVITSYSIHYTKLYELTREKQVFEPLNPERVTMYVCGPTVYNYAHIGNARPAVVFDLLHRLLQLHYPEVVYARNITDVDDKINEAAASQGVPISEVSGKYADAYHQDMAAIGVRLPTIEPRATSYNFV